MKRNLVIIGAGPAGLAAAVAAYDAGERDLLLLEREPIGGGILNQCIHNGFGLHTFREELTGPEYAARYLQQVRERNIEIMSDTTVLRIGKDKVVACVNRDGMHHIQAKAIILACGCRERPRGAINIAGARCAGVFSAGSAQKLMKPEGYMPGKRVVLLGSGDIGLIMARRMTFEGAKVEAVVELMPYSSGLNRNIVQCLQDFDIPLLFSHTIVQINGEDRVRSVVIAQVDEQRNPIMETARTIECDTVLLSVGLLPENELAKTGGVTLSPVTGGAIVDDTMMTDQDGVFACGNVLHVHDLVDFVSQESAHAGACAAKYIRDRASSDAYVDVRASGGVRYVVPQRIATRGDDVEISLKMRVANVFRNVRIVARLDGQEIVAKRKQVVTPGEMETLTLKPSVVAQVRAGRTLEVTLEEQSV